VVFSLVVAVCLFVVSPPDLLKAQAGCEEGSGLSGGIDVDAACIHSTSELLVAALNWRLLPLGSVR
jgi:hypothetical protein